MQSMDVEKNQMIAVDTNILIYAHRKDSPWHEMAFCQLKRLAEEGNLWSIPWPCIHEFLAISTHLKIFSPPSTLKQAIDQVDAWISSPSLKVIGEADNYWELLKKTLSDGKVVGPMVHDMRIASICLEHGISELWTADRDFSRSRIRVVNPLL